MLLLLNCHRLSCLRPLQPKMEVELGVERRMVREYQRRQLELELLELEQLELEQLELELLELELLGFRLHLLEQEFRLHLLESEFLLEQELE